MRTLVRSASLTDYLEVARAVGLDPSRMLDSVGLSRRCLQNPDFKVPEDAVRRLLEASAAAAGIDDFGLRLAEKRTFSNLGPLGLLLRDQPTVRHALEAWNQNRKLHTDSVSLRFQERDGNAIISLALAVEMPSPKRQAVELTIGVLYRTLRLFLGDGWRPRVCFAHSAPLNLDTHRRVFGAKIEFNRDFNGIICRSSDLEASMPAADPAMARYAQQYIDSIASTDGTFGEKVRELVNQILSSGNCRIERIAMHLGFDRRTVHRRLAEEGTNFS
ncbi:MAG: AraC family transcriptional regulator, partial [Candidatus Binatus sp.]